MMATTAALDSDLERLVFGSLAGDAGIPLRELHPGFEKDLDFLKAVGAPGPFGFVVKIDPEQTYFPKISSRITKSGGMESNPLHLMTPELAREAAISFLRYLKT